MARQVVQTPQRLLDVLITAPLLIKPNLILILGSVRLGTTPVHYCLSGLRLNCTYKQNSGSASDRADSQSQFRIMGLLLQNGCLFVHKGLSVHIQLLTISDQSPNRNSSHLN